MRYAILTALAMGLVSGCGSGSPTAGRQATPAEQEAASNALRKSVEGKPRPPTDPGTIAGQQGVQNVPRVSVSAWALWDEYGRNPILADSTYKGKALLIQAELEKVLPGEKGGYILNLGSPSPAGMTPEQLQAMSPQERKWHSEGFPPNIVGNVLAANAEPFAKAIRQLVEIEGTCRGMERTTDVWQGYRVILDDCVLKSAKEPPPPTKEPKTKKK